MEKGDIIFVKKVEEYWDKPYTIKRHHTTETKSVILKCKVVEIKGNEFRAELFENNGFEKDGGIFVFNNGELLSNQDYKGELGVWK